MVVMGLIYDGMPMLIVPEQHFTHSCNENYIYMVCMTLLDHIRNYTS